MLTKLASALFLLPLALGCGAPDPDLDPSVKNARFEIRTAGSYDSINALWSTQPYADPASGKAYIVKVADLAGTPFGSDPATFGPFPVGYPLPADLKSCFWISSYFKTDGTPTTDCRCLVAQVPPVWAGSFTVATPPPATSPVNLAYRNPSGGTIVYMPCFDRPDRGYVVVGGKVEFRG